MPYGFDAAALTDAQLAELAERRRHTTADVVRLVSLSKSGHPGGSLSTLDALLVLYACMSNDPAEPRAEDRDRVIVSHGHISPGVYATLASFGYFDIEDAYVGFRRAGAAYGGHIETIVPGVEWNTGNLGQGLSAGAGFATAGRAHGQSWNVFVGMGDGEQQKGQIAEARRYARQFGLNNLIAFVDVNDLQIGGRTDDIMRTDLQKLWEADGWNVLDVDGHDHQSLYQAFRKAVKHETADPNAPTVLLLRTVMGKGVACIEGDHKYHGQALDDGKAAEMFAQLGLDNNLDALRTLRAETPLKPVDHTVPVDRDIVLDLGTPRVYDAGTKTDCRSAYGNALEDLAAANKDNADAWPILGFSCDLEGSVKMGGFHKQTPERFIEAGIAEHNVAVVAGAASKERTVPFFSTFGMFGIVETYNQQRLNDQNHASANVVVTHCGLDVGEDGPTHQCVDWIALVQNLYGAELFAPADPNETDRIVRSIAGRYGMSFVTMGRSKMNTILAEDGTPAFGEGYTFTPGVWTQLRGGDDAVVFTMGAMVGQAIEASDALRAEGVNLRVVSCSSLKPLDVDMIVKCANEVGRFITFEDHNAGTGLGQLIAGVLVDQGASASLARLGATHYGTSGPAVDAMAAQGLSVENLKATAKRVAGA